MYQAFPIRNWNLLAAYEHSELRMLRYRLWWLLKTAEVQRVSLLLLHHQICVLGPLRCHGVLRHLFRANIP